MGSNPVPATTFVIILLPFWSKRRDGRAFFRMQGGRLIRSSSGRDNAVETAASIRLRLITLPNWRLRLDPTTTALQGQDQGAGRDVTDTPTGGGKFRREACFLFEGSSSHHAVIYVPTGLVVMALRNASGEAMVEMVCVPSPTP